MNKIIFRFHIVKNNEYFEVTFDNRLSFNENFNLLNDIYPLSFNNFQIFDENSNSFLDLDVEIREYGFSYYNKLLIF